MIPWLGCLTPSLSEQPRASNSWSDRKPLVAALLDNQKLRSLPHSTLCKKLKRWCRSLALCCCEANFNPIFWCRSNKLLCTSKMLHQRFHIWKSHKFVVSQNLFWKKLVDCCCYHMNQTAPFMFASNFARLVQIWHKRRQIMILTMTKEVIKMTSKDYQRINY